MINNVYNHTYHIMMQTYSKFVFESFQLRRNVVDVHRQKWARKSVLNFQLTDRNHSSYSNFIHPKESSQWKLHNVRCYDPLKIKLYWKFTAIYTWFTINFKWRPATLRVCSTGSTARSIWSRDSFSVIRLV